MSSTSLVWRSGPPLEEEFNSAAHPGDDGYADSRTPVDSLWRPGFTA